MSLKTEYIAERTTHRPQFTRYKNQINFNNETVSFYELLLSKIEPICDELFMLDAGIIDGNQAITEYVNAALETVASLHEIIENLSNKPLQEVNRNKANLSNVNLPRITLSSYDGTFEKWSAFRDTFSSLIHQNRSYHSDQKISLFESLASWPANR